MSQHDWERALWVLAALSVRIGVADTGVVDLNADFVCLWCCNLDLFNGQIFPSLPGDCGLASDGLSGS